MTTVVDEGDFGPERWYGILGASALSRAAPPSSQRTTSHTSTPFRRARIACAGSCASREAKKTTAVSGPTGQYTGHARPG
ncbi:hypothetical protein ACFY8W_04950 [Streptomyces sp. NPDC012637]|uniref:hypothetical protein n=1 Tax=Streptomyces sp. NPDC012637 TaxID=3364842 RepID=UPI0036E5A5DF